ncbi:MAG TPA: CPBP family intramembrane glutamic endopeptidase [Puia sp.]|nr:CPBP family intramembrane glutamic endopeptidase [Puia sp.]
MTITFIRKFPVAIYFGLTFFISWTGAFLLVANKIIKNEPITTLDGILMFPIMLLGPVISGILMNYALGKRSAVRELFGRMKLSRTKNAWLLSLLIPPLLIFIALLALSVFISKEYEPGFFLMGILFGIPAGFLEELGWMGFAFPQMIRFRSAFNSSIVLGLIWSVWHLPVINFLGAASPHGSYWFIYFLSFATVMTAMRVIIAWVYVNSHSLLLCQLLHISSTGFLVVFSPSPISGQHEPVWYFFYALLLWVLVGMIYYKYGKNLVRKSSL